VLWLGLMVRLWLVSGTKADDREGDFPGADVHGGQMSYIPPENSRVDDRPVRV